MQIYSKIIQSVLTIRNVKTILFPEVPGLNAVSDSNSCTNTNTIFRKILPKLR